MRLRVRECVRERAGAAAGHDSSSASRDGSATNSIATLTRLRWPNGITLYNDICSKERERREVRKALHTEKVGVHLEQVDTRTERTARNSPFKFVSDDAISDAN